jgi:hypothetical protein
VVVDIGLGYLFQACNELSLLVSLQKIFAGLPQIYLARRFPTRLSLVGSGLESGPQDSPS